jgi:hypothetical protein
MVRWFQWRIEEMRKMADKDLKIPGYDAARDAENKAILLGDFDSAETHRQRACKILARYNAKKAD